VGWVCEEAPKAIGKSFCFFFRKKEDAQRHSAEMHIFATLTKSIMEQIINTIKASRKKLLSIVEGLTVEQLNKIPTGFNNNLAWQIGHLVVSQQVLCYRLSGIDFVIDPSLIDKYKNGSKPEGFIAEAEINQLKTYLLDTIDQLVIDLLEEKFAGFKPYTISTYSGFELKRIEDVITFVLNHDGLHLGCSMMMKKLV
jgi:hypothetical protein